MHGDPDNLETLPYKREYEHYRKATSEDIEILLKTVERSPSDLVHEFGRWTAERLTTYLTEKTGIELSSSQVTNIASKNTGSLLNATFSSKLSYKFLNCPNRKGIIPLNDL